MKVRLVSDVDDDLIFDQLEVGDVVVVTQTEEDDDRDIKVGDVVVSGRRELVVWRSKLSVNWFAGMRFRRLRKGERVVIEGE